MTIKEVSDKLGLSVHTLRYYEKEGLIRNIKRNINGFRNYSDNDVGWLDLIMKLKLTRMPLKDLKKQQISYQTTSNGAIKTNDCYNVKNKNKK